MKTLQINDPVLLFKQDSKSDKAKYDRKEERRKINSSRSNHLLGHDFPF